MGELEGLQGGRGSRSCLLWFHWLEHGHMTTRLCWEGPGRREWRRDWFSHSISPHRDPSYGLDVTWQSLLMKGTICIMVPTTNLVYLTNTWCYRRFVCLDPWDCVFSFANRYLIFIQLYSHVRLSSPPSVLSLRFHSQMVKNASDSLGRRMEKLVMFNPHSSVSLLYSPSFLCSLILYATLIGVRSKIFKYFKYLCVT